LEIGAISIATSISDFAYAATLRREWRTFFVRKQAKDHGLGRLVEGVIKPGDRALFVDDVPTSGGSGAEGAHGHAIPGERLGGSACCTTCLVISRISSDAGKGRIAGCDGGLSSWLDAAHRAVDVIKHYVRIFEVEYIRDQVYLNPHPKELMLRNDV
jgi:hypothetical protein